jgi:hypothetical protein
MSIAKEAGEDPKAQKLWYGWVNFHATGNNDRPFQKMQSVPIDCTVVHF